jgi:hypothetical protein
MTDAASGTRLRKRYTWVWILVGILVFCCIVIVGGITFTALWFRQNMNITDVSDSSAATEFDSVRAKFAGQRPLFELRDGRPQLNAENTGKTSTAPLTTMHILAWDSDEGKLVKFSIPFWLLRMKSGPIRIGSYTDGWDDSRVSFTIEDLERHGPGLLIDETERTEGRVLVWVE